MDTDGCVDQCKRITEAGASYVRLTAQGVREAENLGKIRAILRQQGCMTPLVADIHFNPKAAFAAATQVEKVRINPGNFVDPGRTFRKLEYTDDEYAAEIERIRAAFIPFIDVLKQNHTALRIGVNHGSLSDRIMSRYGDTPSGMVESAMEYLRICVDCNFTDVVISIKASNTVIMVETVRRLVKAMEAENMAFPLHLGVTEAGDGEDGRVKSAVGIGTLLNDGIGDTIRVSLSEDPANEIPVADAIVRHISQRQSVPSISGSYSREYNPVSPQRRESVAIGNIGGENTPIAVGVDISAQQLTDNAGIAIIQSSHVNYIGDVQAQLHLMIDNGDKRPAIVKFHYDDADYETVAIKAAIDFGTIIMNGFRDGIWIDAPQLSAEQISRLSLNILQATRQRFTKTEYIACPGCGRTLFDLRTTLAEIKKATSHLKGLKIGVMGCIVNGPGEMADADYGYVGAAAGNISLYKGKTCVAKNIPAGEAIEHLIAILRENGDWVEP
jgi:(E)-4-hydroxy-3-methylbut-2-enyl-diphosphate synthase